MPRRFAVIALTLVSVAWALPAPLTTASQVKSLKPEEARQGVPVLLKGLVTHIAPEWWGFSLQDQSDGIYINVGAPLPENLAVGDLVEVEGHAAPGNFAPIASATRVRVIGPGRWPPAKPVTWQDLASGACDNRYIEVRGVVRSTGLIEPPDWEWRAEAIRLDLGGNLIWAYLRNAKALPGDLVDGTVLVRGVCVVFSNSRRHFQGISLAIPRAADVQVLQPGPRDPFAVPVQSINRVFGFQTGAISFHRVKVEGVVTLRVPGGLYVQEDNDGVLVRTASAPAAAPGDRVEAVGFPAAGAYSTALDDALVRVTGRGREPAPLDAQASAVLRRVQNAPASPDGVLLRLAGRLIDRARSAEGETLILQDHGYLFTARMRTPGNVPALPSPVEAGSRVAVVGVSSIQVDDRGLPRSFELLMRSPADLTVLSQAPWLTEGRALRLAGLLFALAAAALVWLASLRRRVRKQTEIIRAQLAREAALEKRFQDLVENAGDMVYVRDLGGGLQHANRTMEELTGYTRAELLRMNILDLLLPEERERAKRELALRPAEGQDGISTEWRFRAKDGRVLVIETKQRFLIEDGQPARVECIGRDVTARRRALVEAEDAREALSEAHNYLEQRVRERTAELFSAGESLRASEQRFRLAVENFPSVFVIYDRDCRIQFINERGAELAGTTARAAIGRKDEELLPEAVTECYLPALRLCAETRTPQTIECELELAAGKLSMVFHYVPVMDERGELAQILGITHDITERKQLQEQLHHSQRLDSIGKVVGGVAHDFNNLLTVISGYAQMMSEDPDQKDRDAVRQISQAADRAASLTRQLLLFSRRQPSKPKTVDLNELAGAFEKMLRRVIPENVELRLALNARAASICADPGHIEQVLMNLVVNARDAMPNGGLLTIETAEFHADRQYAAGHFGVKEGDYVLLSVSDTGVGMTPQVKAQVFEPFFTTKERGKGTGLGLSTVYGIVKASGGNISVDSKPGAGSVFRILFPLVQASASGAEEKAAIVKAAPGNEAILVVEDEPAIRRFVAEVLRSRGYTTLEAANGREALQIVENNAARIDLLLTDVVMPEMGGEEIADRFRQLRPGCPVLHMSGYSDGQTRRIAAADFLEKPFTASTLLSSVRTALDRRAAAGTP